MRRFLALILALAMTLSAVMPSVALAYDSADTSGSSSITEQSSEPSSEEASASKSSASEPEPEPEQPAPEAEPEAEPEQPAPEAEPEAEPEQSGDAESEPESSKDGSLYADTSESAPEEAPVLRQHTLRSTLKTVDGVRYQVTVAYDDTAEIPKGTSLSIVELNQELSEQEKKLPENQKRPYKTEEFVTEKALEQETFDLRQGLEVRDKDLVLFTKFLDLELKKDGRTIQPKSAVTVTVETDVVEEGASDALEVALYNAQATRDWQKERKKLEEEQQKKIKSGKLKEEDAKRFPEKVYTTMLLTNETQKKKGVKLSFEAEELARMGVCAVGGEMKTWKHKDEKVSVFGPRRLKAEVKSAGMNTPKDGLEKMGGFSVQLKEKKKPDYDVTFWVGRRPQTDAVETQADSEEDVGVAAYTLKDGKTKKELLSPGNSEPAAIEAGDKIGLVWDTGFRDRTLEADQVTLSGLLPKRAHVETSDMLWRYSRPEDLSEDVQQGDAATLAAYDISIENRGAEYQPEADNPVTVRIQAAGIAQNKSLQVWHLGENDAVEVIENFQVSGDTISFEADRFSVYLVVQIVLEETLTASDGNTYRVQVKYDDTAHLPEDVMLRAEEVTQDSPDYALYLDQVSQRLDRDADAFGYARFFDISLVSKEDSTVHYQPDTEVEVSIQLIDTPEDTVEDLQVLHIGDKTIDVMDSTADGNALLFKTSSFSIYPIVEGDNGPNARIAYTFWYYNPEHDDYEQIVTQYFRYKDVHPEGGGEGARIYEPAIPGSETEGVNIFDGWHLGKRTGTSVQMLNSQPTTINDLNTQLVATESTDFKEGTIIDVVAKLKEAYYITYSDTNPLNVLRTQLVLKNQNEGQDTTFTPDATVRPTRFGEDLIGWRLESEAANPSATLYEAGTEYTISENITLVPVIANGHWLVFDDNDLVDDGTGKMVSGGASFTPAAFYMNSSKVQEVTERPADPTWDGYIFEGWYSDPACTIPFTFGELLEQDTTVHAKWSKGPSSCTVIIWKQKSTDRADTPDDKKTYDFDQSFRLGVDTNGDPDGSIKTGDLVWLDEQYTKIYGEYGTSNKKDKQFFTFNAEKTPEYVFASANGSSVLDVYYDRVTMTMNFYTWQANNSTTNQYLYKPTNDQSGDLYGYVDGSGYVPIHKAGGSDGVHKYSYTPTYAATTDAADELFGIIDGEYQKLDQRAVYSFTRNQYEETTDTTSSPDQYALVDGRYIKLTPHTRYFPAAGTSYTALGNNADNDNDPQKYGVKDGNVVEVYYTSVLNLGMITLGSGWYLIPPNQVTFTNFSANQYSGTCYLKETATASDTPYTGTPYYISGTSAAGSWTSDATTGFETSGSGTAYGKNGNTYFPLREVTYWTYPNQSGNLVEYEGTRYHKLVEQIAYTGQRYTRSGEAWNYTYTPTDEQTTGLYGVDDRGGHLQLTRSDQPTSYVYSYNGVAYDETLYRVQDQTPVTYVGAHYQKTAPGSFTETPANGENLYGRDLNGAYRELRYTVTYPDVWKYEDPTTHEEKIYPSSAQRYTGTPKHDGKSWQIYKSYTGLYGVSLSTYHYEWPTDYNWYYYGGKIKDGGNADSYNNSNIDSGKTAGSRMTLKTTFEPLDNSLLASFYAGQKTTTGSEIIFYLEQPDGSYVEDNRFNTGSTSVTSFNINDKYSGFHAAQYKTDVYKSGNSYYLDNNPSWKDVGDKDATTGYYGSAVAFYQKLEIRYDRTGYNFNYLTNNATNEIVSQKDVPYQSSLAGFDDYGNQHRGQKPGYYFVGWFADDVFSKPVFFDQESYDASSADSDHKALMKEMPDHDETVYGYWRKERTRVVIVPGGSDVHMGSQALSFRLDYGERISGTLLESATRLGYILDGWYTDPEFTNRFLFSTPVISGLTGVSSDYQTAARWTASRVLYHDDDDAHSNVRNIITLYAKWDVDPNIQGIKVIYDAGEAAKHDTMGNVTTTIPVDSFLYQQDSEAVVGPPPSNYNELFVFDYWEAVDGNGNPFQVYYDGNPISQLQYGTVFSVNLNNESQYITQTPLLKVIKLRAHYHPSDQSSNYTNITYDGNQFSRPNYPSGTEQVHGKTRDGQDQQSVTLDTRINATVVLPGVDDFYLNGYTLDGWSFFPGDSDSQNSQLESYNASNPSDTLDHFKASQKVAADQLAQGTVNTGDNKLYAVWKPKTYTVTVKQVVEDGVTDKNFPYQYRSGVENAVSGNQTLSLNGTAQEKYTTLTTDSTAQLEYYERKGHVFQIQPPTIGNNKDYTRRVTAYVTRDNGTREAITPQTIGNYSSYRIYGDITITYTYSPKVKVLLYKKDQADKINLNGSKFTLTPVEWDPDVSRWVEIGDAEEFNMSSSYKSDNTLQEGVYRVDETKAPANYAPLGVSLLLTVKRKEDFSLTLMNGNAVSEEIAKLSATSGSNGDGGDGKKHTLTLYDRPIKTITVTKQLSGTEVNENRFGFTAHVSLEGADLGSFDTGTSGNAQDTTNSSGFIEFTLKKGDSKEIRIPYGSVLTITEKTPMTEGYYLENVTSASSVTDTADEANVFSFTAEADNTITFQNIRPICKIMDGSTEKPFVTLREAITYAEDHMDGSATVEMLTDYTMLDTDTVTIASTDTITLTTAMTAAQDTADNSVSYVYHYTGAQKNDATPCALITRGFNGDSMVSNAGDLTLTNITLDGNRSAYTSTADGTLVYSSGGALRLKDGATLQNASTTDGRGGAVAVRNSGSRFYMEGTARVYNCHAYHGGGIHLGDDGVVGEITGGTVEACEAQGWGGGIFVHHSTLTMTGGTVTLCAAGSGNGGGINIGCGSTATVGGSVTISNCTAPNGGGINVDPNHNVQGVNTLNLTGGTITACSAVGTGAALYVDVEGTANISGGSIQANNVSATCGAVAIWDATARLNFSGTALVYGNTYDDNGTAQQKNVVLSEDSNDVINVTAALEAGAKIGVYDATSTANHRNAGERFGSHGSGLTDRLSAFKNDLNPQYFGVKADEAGKIMWCGLCVETYKYTDNGFGAAELIDSGYYAFSEDQNPAAPILVDDILTAMQTSYPGKFTAPEGYAYDTSVYGETRNIYAIYTDGRYMVYVRQDNGTIDMVDAVKNGAALNCYGQKLKVYFYRTSGLVPVLVEKKWDADDAQIAENDSTPIQFSILNGSTPVSLYTDSSSTTGSPKESIVKEDTAIIGNTDTATEWAKLLYVPGAAGTYSITENSTPVDSESGAWSIDPSVKDVDNGSPLEDGVWVEVDNSNLEDAYIKMPCIHISTKTGQDGSKIPDYNDVDSLILQIESVDGYCFRMEVKMSEDVNFEKDKTYYIPVKLPKDVPYCALILPQSNGHNVLKKVVSPYQTGETFYGIKTSSTTRNGETHQPRFTEYGLYDNGLPNSTGGPIIFENVAFVHEPDVTASDPNKIVIDGAKITSSTLRVFARKRFTLTNIFSRYPEVQVYSYEKGHLDQATELYSGPYPMAVGDERTVEEIKTALIGDNKYTEPDGYRYDTAVVGENRGVTAIEVSDRNTFQYKVGTSENQPFPDGETLKIYYVKSDDLQPVIIRKEWDAPDAQKTANESVSIPFTVNGRNQVYPSNAVVSSTITQITKDSTATVVGLGTNPTEWATLAFVPRADSYTIEEDSSNLTVVDGTNGQWAVSYPDYITPGGNSYNDWATVAALTNASLMDAEVEAQTNARVAYLRVKNNESSSSTTDKLRVMYKDIDGVVYESYAEYSATLFNSKEYLYFRIPVPQNVDLDSLELLFNGDSYYGQEPYYNSLSATNKSYGIIFSMTAPKVELRAAKFQQTGFIRAGYQSNRAFTDITFLAASPDSTKTVDYTTATLKVYAPTRLTMKNTFTRSFTVSKSWVDVPETDQANLEVDVALYKVTGTAPITISNYTTEAQAAEKIAGKTPEATYTLKAGEWSHTFTDLDASADYFAVETAVRDVSTSPATEVTKYLASYTYNQAEGTLTITNGDYIARVGVADDQGSVSDWTYHSYMISPNASATGSNVGAFNRANTLSGNVVIETLKKGDDGTTDDTKYEGDTVGRYHLASGVTISKNITLRTTQATRWNPADDGHFRSILIRGSGNNDSLFTVGTGVTLTTESIILDGGAKFTAAGVYDNEGEVNVNGGIVYVSATDTAVGSLTVGAGTTMRNTAVASGKNGGAIYTQFTTEDGSDGKKYVKTSGQVTVSGRSTDGRSSISFVNCKATQGGAIYTKQTVLTVDYATFEYNTGSNGGGSIWHNIYGSDSSLTTSFAAIAGSKTHVSHCLFEHGRTTSTTQRETGGGIFSNCGEVELSYCDFNDCKARHQGGGVFHYPNNNEGSRGTYFKATNCQFTDCEAGFGGTSDSNGATGGALETSAFTDTFIDCNFTDCTAQRNGGAFNIWNSLNNKYEAEIEVTRCNFVKCRTRVTTVNDRQGLGGAVRNTGKSTLVTDCTFIECSSGRGGALFCNDGTTYIQGNTSIIDCVATDKGGGIYQNAGTLHLWPTSAQSLPSGTQSTGYGSMPTGITSPTVKTMDNCTAPNGGGVYLGGNKPNVYIYSGTISSCKATSSGGGVYVGGTTPTLHCNGGTITGCLAKSNGGGVYLASGTLNLNSGTITECKAKSNGGGVYLAGGSVNQPNTKTAYTGSEISQCYAGLGGGMYVDGDQTNITISKSGDAITGCEAKTVTIADDWTVTLAATSASGEVGGGIYQNSGTLKITNATISNCNAYDGGGIYLAETGTMTIGEVDNASKPDGKNGGVITGCRAVHDGGGIYQNNGTLDIYLGSRIMNNHADQGNGGGILLGAGEFKIHSGAVGGTGTDQGNSANQGGGLFVNNNARAYILGGNVKGNTATSLGGGIAVGGEGSRLYFAGSIQVWSNTVKNGDDNPTEGQQCDVCLNYDTDEIIRTTADGLKEESHIGVYVTGNKTDPDSIFGMHGKSGKPFGKFRNDDGSNCYDSSLNRFINNRSGDKYSHYEYYYGVRKSEADSPPGDPRIYWADYVCKITYTYTDPDTGKSEERLLFTNNLGTAPALYQFLGRDGAFQALKRNTQFYYRDENDEYQEYTENEFHVLMLKNTYSLRWSETITVPGKIITLSMVEQSDNDYSDDPTKYDGSCHIDRGNCTDSMFTSEAGGSLTLTYITLDGGATYNSTTGTLSGTSVSADGGLIHASGNLTIGNGTKLLNSITNGNGGAVWCAGDFTLNADTAVNRPKIDPVPMIYQCEATNGGGLFQHAGTATINQGKIKDCKADEKGGAIGLDGGTVEIKASDVVTACHATSGGAIYQNGGTLNVTVANALTNFSATQGGAVYVDKGTLNITALNGINNCYATQGGAVYVQGGTLKVTTGSISDCKAITAGNDEGHGGAVYVIGGGKLELSGDQNIKNCSASKGGAVYQAAGTVNIKNGDNTTAIKDCKAITVTKTVSSTGAVTLSEADSAVEGNDGGAVYMAAGSSLTIQGSGTSISDCSAYTGGAVYENGGEVYIKDGRITGNTAAIGGGVFVNTGATLKMNGYKDSSGTQFHAEITNNTATVKGGGIAVGPVDGDNKPVLKFANISNVTGNKMTVGSEQVDCNVYLDVDSSEVIQVNQWLSSNATIGVYVPGDMESTTSQFGKHGAAATPFGKVNLATGTNPGSLNRFRNDRVPYLYGMKVDNDNTIYWPIFNFKITVKSDGADDGELLYMDEACTVPAAFVKLEGASEPASNVDPSVSTDVTSVFSVLYPASPALYRKGSSGTYSGEYAVKMLVETYTDQGASNVGKDTSDKDKKITLTKAGADSDGFPYRGTAETPTIVRGSFAKIMFKVYCNLTVENITIDGDEKTATEHGGIFNIAGSGTLNLSAGTTLQNSYTSKGGGAICINGTNATLNMTGATITNCHSEGDDGGGAVIIYQNGTFNFNGGTIKNCTATKKGAAICINNNNNCKLRLKGSLGFSGNYVDMDGYSSCQNGGESVYTNNKVRQDIYFEKTGNPVEVIAVTGNITMGDSDNDHKTDEIWVWAVNNPHYLENRQFAVIDSTVNDASLEAFRNARPDDVTTASRERTEPLVGIRNPETGKETQVIWGTSGEVVFFSKTDGYGAILEGAIFSLYKDDPSCTSGNEANLRVAETPDGSLAVTQTTVKSWNAADAAQTESGKNVNFKVGNGVYYMKEVNSDEDTDTTNDWPTTTANGKTTTWKSDMLYVVLVGSSAVRAPTGSESRTGVWATDGVLANIQASDVEAQTGTGATAKKFAVFLIDPTTHKAVATPDIAAKGIMNESAWKHKVILRKVNASNAPLAGSRFRIFKEDLTEITEGHVSGKSYYESGASGAYYIGNLSEGKYYLVECGWNEESTDYTAYHSNVGKVFVMTVDAEGGINPGSAKGKVALTDESAMMTELKELAETH